MLWAYRSWRQSASKYYKHRHDEVVAAALLQLLHTRSQAAEFCLQVGINQPRQGQRLSKEEVEEQHYQASI